MWSKKTCCHYSARYCDIINDKWGLSIVQHNFVILPDKIRMMWHLLGSAPNKWVLLHYCLICDDMILWRKDAGEVSALWFISEDNIYCHVLKILSLIAFVFDNHITGIATNNVIMYIFCEYTTISSRINISNCSTSRYRPQPQISVGL